jgi:hypothetical protein
MVRETIVDVTNNPELLRLAEEVHATNSRRVLRRDSEDIAVLMPLRKRRAAKRPSPSDIEATLSSSGGWQGLVDVEELKRQIKEGREGRRVGRGAA